MTDRTPHLEPKEVVEVVDTILNRAGFADMCPDCAMAILATLVGQYTFHAVNAKHREEYIADILNHTRTIALGMEKHYEHDDVTH